MANSAIGANLSKERRRSGSENRSSHAVLVRISPKDFALLSARADAAGVTVQELMRQAALAAKTAPKSRRRPPTHEAALCDGDRARVSALFRATSSLAGLLVQAAKGERIASGQTELWRALERHLDALAESRQALRDILEKFR
jgi:hypothetical protein